MKNFMSRLTLALVTAVLVAGTAGSAFAQVKRDDEKEQKTKETVAMSQQVYEQLSEIQELIEAKDYATAQRKIEDLRGKTLIDNAGHWVQVEQPEKTTAALMEFLKGLR